LSVFIENGAFRSARFSTKYAMPKTGENIVPQLKTASTRTRFAPILCETRLYAPDGCELRHLGTGVKFWFKSIFGVPDGRHRSNFQGRP
ncbi:MAG TPA: hypothetical protein VN689_05620, partial [Burkholderiales bacterium]|nr:hypothetical protein [Burkholderiales bacterium]